MDIRVLQIVTHTPGMQSIVEEDNRARVFLASLTYAGAPFRGPLLRALEGKWPWKCDGCAWSLSRQSRKSCTDNPMLSLGKKATEWLLPQWADTHFGLNLKLLRLVRSQGVKNQGHTENEGCRECLCSRQLPTHATQEKWGLQRSLCECPQSS